MTRALKIIVKLSEKRGGVAGGGVFILPFFSSVNTLLPFGFRKKTIFFWVIFWFLCWLMFYVFSVFFSSLVYGMFFLILLSDDHLKFVHQLRLLNATCMGVETLPKCEVELVYWVMALFINKSFSFISVLIYFHHG